MCWKFSPRVFLASFMTYFVVRKRIKDLYSKGIVRGGEWWMMTGLVAIGVVILCSLWSLSQPWSGVGYTTIPVSYPNFNTLRTFIHYINDCSKDLGGGPQQSTPAFFLHPQSIAKLCVKRIPVSDKIAHRIHFYLSQNAGSGDGFSSLLLWDTGVGSPYLLAYAASSPAAKKAIAFHDGDTFDLYRVYLNVMDIGSVPLVSLKDAPLQDDPVPQFEKELILLSGRPCPSCLRIGLELINSGAVKSLVLQTDDDQLQSFGAWTSSLTNSTLQDESLSNAMKTVSHSQLKIGGSRHQILHQFWQEV